MKLNVKMKIEEITAEQTYGLRKKELRKNMSLSSKFRGDLDADTFHLGLFINNEIVSIVSFMRSDHKEFTEKQFQLRGMATKENYQGKGFGKMLITKSEELLKEKEVIIVWCNARIVALDFYKKQGFKIIGKEFDIPQIGGHFVMYKKLI